MAAVGFSLLKRPACSSAAWLLPASMTRQITSAGCYARNLGRCSQVAFGNIGQWQYASLRRTASSLASQRSPQVSSGSDYAACSWCCYFVHSADSLAELGRCFGVAHHLCPDSFTARRDDIRPGALPLLPSLLFFSPPASSQTSKPDFCFFLFHLFLFSHLFHRAELC
ncbi:hypothetical protein VTK56DRAFT_1895 [Thermocarpiscus australiensis]